MTNQRSDNARPREYLLKNMCTSGDGQMITVVVMKERQTYIKGHLQNSGFDHLQQNKAGREKKKSACLSVGMTTNC
jgi:hypothetical protein